MTVSRWARARAKRQLKTASKLLDRSVFSEVEYASIAVATVAELSGEDLRRPDGWQVAASVGASMPELHRLAMMPTDRGPVSPPEVSALDLGDEFGPVASAFWILGQAQIMRVNPGGFDIFTMQRNPRRLEWGDLADRTLRDARRRLASWNRVAERIDHWRGEQAEILPHLHKDVWHWVLAIVTFVLGLALGSNLTH